MRVLSLNTGSNSLKFQVVDVGPEPFGHAAISGAYDNVGKDGGLFTLFEGKKQMEQKPVEIADYGHATELLFDWLAAEGHAAGIERVGHRVVHGGDWFRGPARIDAEVARRIEELQDLAPLHNASALQAIRAAQKRAEARVPQVAVFDTVFHQTIPDEAGLYALPLELAEKHKIRRYGFHGISHRYMLMRYAALRGKAVEEVNAVTLHLEGGSSAAAIRRGRSVDTSMGLTPLEGLMMGTRAGDMDAAIVPYLMRKEGWDAGEVETFLNRECGLKGVSGRSADTRELWKHRDDAKVELAIGMFCYRVRKYVGAYVAAMGGAEAIVFGGGIGENTPGVRERVCEGLECLGAKLDRERNAAAVDREESIGAEDSRIQIWVIPAEEALMVAWETARLGW